MGTDQTIHVVSNLTRGRRAVSILIQSSFKSFFHQIPDFQIISYLFLISKIINFFRWQNVKFKILSDETWVSDDDAQIMRIHSDRLYYMLIGLNIYDK